MVNDLNYITIYNNIVNGMIKYITENNLKTQILGISGGVDSTIVARICHDVSKRTGCKLIGVSLMCDTNKEDERNIADEVGELFCDEYYKVNLQELYETTSTFFKDSTPINGMYTKISEGNIKARLRMMYLWNLGGLRNGVVIDTDNLTEHFLGFWTLMGDSNYITPIGNLWKTEVYDLVNYLKREYELFNAPYIMKNTFSMAKGGEYCVNNRALIEIDDKERNFYERCVLVFEKVLNIVPTDGNGVSNSDLEQIGGKSYKEVDDILKTIVSNNFNVDEYIRLSKKYSVETVDKVINRYKNSEFKRKHLPLSINCLNGDIVEKRIVNNIKYEAVWQNKN